MNFTEFYNKEGKSILVRFREFQTKDAEAIVNLICDEYGDKYHTPELYDKDIIIQRYREGKIIFHVAELTTGEIIACLNMKRSLPQEECYSMGTGIVLKTYRKYHIFEPLIKYVMEQIGGGASAIHALLVMYHEITQHSIDRLGLKPCGFIFSMVLADKFTHSFKKDDNLKYHFILTACKVSKNDAGTLYLSAEHENISSKIYDSFEVKFEIKTAGVDLSGKSVVNVEDSPIHQNCSIYIDSAGADLFERITEIESQHQQPFQTFNAFLNINDEKSIAAYETLKSLGYFFAGFKPLAGKYEFMIMHNPKKVPIHFDTLLAIEHFAFLKDYIKQCYESRCKIENRTNGHKKTGPVFIFVV